MTFREALVAIVDQTEKNNFIDNNGHQFVQSKAYLDAKAMLDRDKPTHQQAFIPTTQREALAGLIEQVELRGTGDIERLDAFRNAKTVLARRDEMTLEEVRQLMIADNIREGISQAVVVTASRFMLIPLACVDTLAPGYEDRAVPPHNADGTLPLSGHPDMPNGEPPSMQNLRSFLEG